MERTGDFLAYCITASTSLGSISTCSGVPIGHSPLGKLITLELLGDDTGAKDFSEEQADVVRIRLAAPANMASLA
ncbi:hypothetical protein D3C78_1955210 [compost metagenome]